MMDMEAVMNTLPWGKPEIVQGKAMLRAKPNSMFWDLWRLEKTHLKNQGVFVTKEKDAYYVVRWLPINVVYSGSKKPSVKVKGKLRTSGKLLGYQHEHTLALVNAMNRNGAALDGSDTGTGKTYTALGVARELKLTPFVVCPKSAIANWKRVAKYMNIKGLVAINYEMLKTWKTEHLRKLTIRGKEMEWLLPREETLIIFDEVHRCKSYSSINSKLLIYASMQGYRILMMSATVADNPLQMKATGFALGLFPRVQDFWPWAKLHGCYRNRFEGMEFSGSHLILQKIHQYLYPEKGSRMIIAELGDAFPDNQILAEPYFMDTAGKIQRAYEEMEDELAELESRSRLDGESALTIILRARQKVELLKVPTFVEMTKDLVEEGHSVVLFVNFTETLENLSDKLKTKCIVWGKQAGKKGAAERQANIEAFQDDKERIIICNIKAGGESISLHDLHGRYSRVSILSPTWSAQELVQALGRIHRSGGRSKALQRIVFAAGTVEETVAKAVQRKIDRIKTLNDGDMTAGFQIEGLRGDK